MLSNTVGSVVNNIENRTENAIGSAVKHAENHALSHQTNSSQQASNQPQHSSYGTTSSSSQSHNGLPRHLDILGIRLGMSHAQVISRLKKHGFIYIPGKSSYSGIDTSDGYYNIKYVGNSLDSTTMDTSSGDYASVNYSLRPNKTRVLSIDYKKKYKNSTQAPSVTSFLHALKSKYGPYTFTDTPNGNTRIFYVWSRHGGLLSKSELKKYRSLNSGCLEPPGGGGSEGLDILHNRFDINACSTSLGVSFNSSGGIVTDYEIYMKDNLDHFDMAKKTYNMAINGQKMEHAREIQHANNNTPAF